MWPKSIKRRISYNNNNMEECGLALFIYFPLLPRLMYVSRADFLFLLKILYLFLYMDVIFRLSGGNGSCPPLFGAGWPISCDLLLIVRPGPGPYKVCPVKKKERQEGICLNITRERISADFLSRTDQISRVTQKT